MSDKYFTYKYDDLFKPTLIALNELGGSASNSEIEESVSEILKLSENATNEIHRGSSTKLAYRLAWAKNYLKRYGLLENSARGVWALNSNSKKLSTNQIKQLDKEAIKKEVKKDINLTKLYNNRNLENQDEDIQWKNDLLDTIKNIEPEQFERLCQRLLRELGFINVNVTGQTGDQGIDGKGILKIGGIISYYVVFQAKRYKGTVPSNVIRDFRGAMEGRADKGLLITTGTYTSEAKKEALRESATIPIDLIDGESFVTHLKNLNLGISIKTKEIVTVNNDWFKGI
jgi:restriction system protein